MNELAEKFEKKIQLDDEDIKDYNRLDNEIIRVIKAEAAKAGRVNFGYQRSKDLCEAGATIRLHKAILSSIRNNMEYNNKIINLAETLSLKLDDRAKITLKQAITNVCEAWKAKQVIEREDSERRAGWLEDLAAEKALETGQEPDKALKQMIQAARTKGVFTRLRAILRSAWSALDYIEVPNEKWYLDKKKKELYEFDNGIFVAHASAGDDLFEQYGTIKIPPNDAIVVNVDASVDMLYVRDPESIKLAT